MKTLRLLFPAIILCLGISATTFAATKDGNAKDPKTTKASNEKANAPEAAKTTTNTYYVLQIDPNNSNLYDITTDQSQANCGTGTSPCEFTDTNTLTGNTVSKSDVDNNRNGIMVQSHQTF